MSSKAKWRASFQKTKSLSQTSLGNSVQRKTSLLEEGDLSVSDDELEQYLGTIKKKSGVNRLWTGNAFDRMIDRTPDVSISSVSDGELEVPFDEEDKNLESDDDFLPKIMTLPSAATEDNNTDISESSSIKPFQAFNLMSDLELASEASLKLASNVKLSLDRQDSDDDVIGKDIKSMSNDISNVEEVKTLDEISEEIEEDIGHDSDNTPKRSSSGGSSHSNTKHRSRQVKDRQSSQRSEERTYSESNQSSPSSSQRVSRHSKSHSGSRHSRTGTKSKRSLKHSSEHSSLDTSRKQTKSHSRHSKAENSKQSRHSSNVSSARSEDLYTTDFSESSKQARTGSSHKSNLDTRSAVSSTKLKSIPDISKKTSKHSINQRYHNVATQVNMDDVTGQKLGVGMAMLGPSFGHHYVGPSPIACHVLSADAVEAVTAYNPAVVALTDMLRQQLRLVEQFVDNSRRMYQSYTNNLNTTYRYTTLEDTLQYMEESNGRHMQKQSK